MHRLEARSHFHRTDMNNSKILSLLALPLLLGACDAGDEAVVDEATEDRTGYEQLGTVADTSTGYETNLAAPVTIVQGGGTVNAGAEAAPITAAGNLRGIAPGAPPGSISVTEQGPGVLFSIKIDRYTAGTPLQAFLVQGGCEGPADPAQAIGEPFEVSEAGFATQEARLDVPARTVFDGRHAVRITNPGDPNSAPTIVLACAELPPAP